MRRLSCLLALTTWLLSFTPPALAGDACRPLRALGAGAVLQFDAHQTALSPRLEGVVAEDMPLADSLQSLGLSAAQPTLTLPAPVTVRPQMLAAGLVDGIAKLSFDPLAQAEGPAVVTSNGRRYLIHSIKGEARNAHGGVLHVRPLTLQARAFTLRQGTQLRVDAAGRPVIEKGSKLVWQLGNNPSFEFELVMPTTLEAITSQPKADAAVKVLKPSRLLPGGTIQLQLRADGFDFRKQPLSFCFGVMPEGQPGAYTLTAPGRLVSESSEGALFEVKVPAGLADASYTPLPGSGIEPEGRQRDWFGKYASVRVMGMNGDDVVFDAAEPFVSSSFHVAWISGLILILVLLLVSGLMLGERDPRRLLTRLVGHRSQRMSLSNVQIMLWTLLVLYAFCFVWVANGLLLDISSGVLVLLGISGGTSVLTRGIENLGEPGAVAPVHGEPRVKDLITNDNGEFDLLRFQMLGFTLFTLAYSLVSVIRSEGLPDIPDNLYLLMGISSGAYVGGKVADNMKPKGDDAAAALTGAERQLKASDISWLQQALQVPETGKLDEATREAVIRYKIAEGIVPADGSVGELLMEKLKDDVLPS